MYVEEVILATRLALVSHAICPVFFAWLPHWFQEPSSVSSMMVENLLSTCFNAGLRMGLLLLLVAYPRVFLR